MTIRVKGEAVRRTRVFRSGNSRAVRLPADCGLEPGQEVEVRREDGRMVIVPVPKRIDLTGIYGSIPDLRKFMLPFEERELDWEGKLLPLAEHG